jgi:hypothetical protein
MDQFLPHILVAVLVAMLLLGAWALWHRRQQMRSPSHARSRAEQSDDLDTVISWEPRSTRVLTTPEREAYHTLRKALPDHMIMAQLPLARFLKVPTRNSYSEWLRRVGSLCADLVICDDNAHVVAVVEVRQPAGGKDRERMLKRHTRLDRVLEAAHIPVHVWLEGALPGPAVARETILGGGVTFTTRSGATLVDTSAAQRNLGAAVSMLPIDLDVDDDTTSGEASRRMSTWFDSAQSGIMPLQDTPTGR